ncbi:hypothetical protein BABINDRAFT_165255 [Babjeviella inositovora NRRL Y-12698]|uniref:Ell binding protein Ebp1 C-terminal domain-containing protein n=1 Tax=Babjeviella inositovora NRRL Y-12698 TaxID=984486 RepID=A0A1E3QVP3_9ASCO|nr:uncharacterized protein BABINDRAFT_165255 [Babjeviella inositovora NRRL Y-12698]ODQ81730.1 hypothetical protein BABINDRAFT_165255 [Babjeviella inositovora NRRL Y-12698]
MSMKSSIFGKSAIQATLEHKRKKPTVKKPLSPGAPPPTNPRKWDADQLIKTYTNSGTLPPLLSPTLPTTEGVDAIPMKMLSPTLPPSFDHFDSEEEPVRTKKPKLSPQSLQPVSLLTSQSSNNSVYHSSTHAINVKSTPTISPSVKLNLMTSPSKPVPVIHVTSPVKASPIANNSSKSVQKPIRSLSPETDTKVMSFERTEHNGRHMYIIKKTPTSFSLNVSLALPQRFLSSLPDARPANISMGLGIYKKKAQTELEAAIRERRASHGEAVVRKPSVTGRLQDIQEERRETRKAPKIESEKEERDKKEDREASKSLLMKKKAHWSLVAREQKHKADELKTSNPKLALLYCFDSLIVYMVAFDYEDRSRHAMKQLLSERNWNSLLPYISHISKLAETANRLSLAGLCLQFQAVISQHIAKILKNVIVSYRDKKAGLKEADAKKLSELNEKIIQLQETNLKCCDDVRSMLYRAECILNLDALNKFYPDTFDNKARKPLRVASRADQSSFFPAADLFYLPISCFTSLQEMAAYGYSVVREFAHSEGLPFDWTLDSKA